MTAARVPPVTTDPLRLAFLAVTEVFQTFVSVCPAPHDHVNVQLVTGSPRSAIDTWTPKPPGHCDGTA